MTPGRRLLIAGLSAGALLRAAALPLPGTGDVAIWKVWSFAATFDVAGMYGVGGAPPERRVLHWNGEAMTVDYPPIALYELALAGKLYSWISPAFQDSRTLNVVVKLPGLAAEVLLVAAMFAAARGRVAPEAVTWAILAIWLNPATVLDGAVLGYLDLQMAVPLVAAIWCAGIGRPLLAGAFAAVAVLTKAQAIFALPVILAFVFWRLKPRWPSLAVAAAAGAAVSWAAVLPFVVRGAWRNLAQAIGRLATHDMLSAQAPNVWWIFTWILRVRDVAGEWGLRRALTQEVRILAITRAQALGYPNARTVGLVLTGAAIVWAVIRMRQVRTMAELMALAGWCLYAYALFAAQVHENHQVAAVLPLAIAAALAPPYRRVFWLTSGVVAVNLYLFYGLGAGFPPLVARTATGIDATVVLSVINIGAFVWLTYAIVRRTARPLTLR